MSQADEKEKARSVELIANLPAIFWDESVAKTHDLAAPLAEEFQESASHPGGGW